MSVRLTSIEIQAFRGFRDLQRLELDADVVLLRGDNGSGKTSVTDAIQWVLTGSLPHLQARMQGVRGAEDPIDNAYRRGEAVVTLDLRAGAESWRVQRSGGIQASELSLWRNGSAVQSDGQALLARAFGERDLESMATAVTTWGVLRQDAIRSVLDRGGAALHDRMSSVIGMESITRFRDACREAEKEAARARREARERLNAAAERSERAVRHLEEARAFKVERERRPLAGLVRAVIEQVSDVLVVDSTATVDQESVIRLTSRIRKVSQLADAASRARAAHLQAELSIPRPSADLENELEAVAKQLEGLEAGTSEVERLAEAALPLLGHSCPVCDQEIDLAEVQAKLLGQIEESRFRVAAAREARFTMQRTSEALAASRFAEQNAARASADYQRTRNELAASLSDEVRLREPALVWDSHELVTQRLAELLNGLLRALEEVAAQSTASEFRLLADMDAAKNEEANVRRAFESARRVEHQASALASAARAASESIISQWLRELEPSFAEVFDRLSPHPTFSELRARQDTYYKTNRIVPVVVDPIRDVQANPMMVYSEGQLNTVALSYFLGLSLNAPDDGLGFMVLDDPLQSMDILSVLAFADMCRRLRSDRQLILTTHDRRFADILVRKLSPRLASEATILHEFTSWFVEGPSVESSRVTTTRSREPRLQPPYSA